jgi:hypothetical protein
MEHAFSSAAMNIHCSKTVQGNYVQANGCLAIIMCKEEISQELERFMNTKLVFEFDGMGKENNCPAGHLTK